MEKFKNIRRYRYSGRTAARVWRGWIGVVCVEFIYLFDFADEIRFRQGQVSHETRQVLLGHKNGQITTHYSAAEIGELIEAVEKVS